MPSFASGLAAGLSPGINFYGQRLAEDRAEKRFDTRLAEQRNYTVMQGLISEAEKWGVPSNDIAEMASFGDTSAFRSVLEEAKADFNAGSSLTPTVPTKGQSESPSFLYGQSARDRKLSQDASDQNNIQQGKILDEVRLVKRTASQRDAETVAALVKQAQELGVGQDQLNSLRASGDIDSLSKVVEKAQQFYNAGSSLTGTHSANLYDEKPGDLSYLSAFEKGENLKNERGAAVAESARQALAVKVADEIRNEVTNIRGISPNIAGLPFELKERLFSNDPEVSRAAASEISLNTTLRRESDAASGKVREFYQYTVTPKPKPVVAAAGKNPPPNSLAAAGNPPFDEGGEGGFNRPQLSLEEQERDMLIKVPIIGWPKEMDERLKSNDPKIWREALKETKANISLAPTQSTEGQDEIATTFGIPNRRPNVTYGRGYVWTPGKSNYQSKFKGQLEDSRLRLLPSYGETVSDSDPR